MLGIGKKNSLILPKTVHSSLKNTYNTMSLGNIPSVAVPTGQISGIYNIGTVSTATIHSNTTTTQLTGTGAAGISTSYNIGTTTNSTIVFNNSNNQEIVRLNKDGSVTWANDINVDEAATAFSRSLQLGAERCAGITQGVKQRMRNTIFEEMIELAKIKGSLNADDLTYMYSAAKIMDKLKGGYE